MRNNQADIRTVIKQSDMFNAISWKQYLMVVITILVIYYCVVALIYYRRELVSFFLQGFHKSKRSAEGVLTPAISAEAQTSVLSSSVHELMDELNVLLRKATQQHYPKEELLMALQMKLRDYNSIKGTALQNLVADHIRSESKASCNILLDDLEVARLW